MKFVFNIKSDIHIEIAEDILECLLSKSKWATSAWTWVSLSNLQMYYDTKMVHTYNESYLPEKINLKFFLSHLVKIGLVEKNPELFLRDAFYRLTREGRKLVEVGGEELYIYLAQHKY